MRRRRWSCPPPVVYVAPKPVVVAPPPVVYVPAPAPPCRVCRTARGLCGAGSASGGVGAGALDRACVGAGALGVMRVVMRVKNCFGPRRLRRAATQASSADAAYRMQAGAPALRLRAIYRTASLLTLAAAMASAVAWALAASGVMSGAGFSRGYLADSASRADTANLPGDASGDCFARYAALLDLAELARRDGKSSGVVVRGLSDRRGAMSGCLPVDRAETAQRAAANPHNLERAVSTAKRRFVNPAAPASASNRTPEISPRGSD